VPRAFGIERRQTRDAVRMFFKAGMHRPHQHAVFKLGEAEIKRGEQRRVAHSLFQAIFIMWSDEF